MFTKKEEFKFTVSLTVFVLSFLFIIIIAATDPPSSLESIRYFVISILFCVIVGSLIVISSLRY